MGNHYRITRMLSAVLLMTISVVLPASAKVAEPLLADPLLYVVSTTPLANQLAVDSAAPVEITFNIALNTDTVTTETLTIHGDQTGFYRGAINFSTGTELEISPSTSYKPGEQVFVTASSAISSSGGEPLASHTWGFNVQSGLGSAEFYTHPISPTFGAGDSRAIALGDIDGDLDLDSVVANYGSDNTIWINDGSGEMSDCHQPFDSTESNDLALGDLDNDQDLDIVVVNAGTAAGTVWMNDGNGSYTAHPTAPTFIDGNSSAVALGDIDGDADLDVVVANLNNQAQTVWLNDGEGVLSTHPISPTFGLGYSFDIALGDLDSDGDLDAVVANYVSPTMADIETVWLNDGTGRFSPHPTTPEFEGGDAQAIALGDLDRDGDLDAVVANTDNGAQTVWVNDGFGNLSAHPEDATFGAGNSTGIGLNDLDGDGDLDAVVSNEGSEAQSVWINRGNGIFDAHRHKPSFGTEDSAGLALGDLNGDQVLDVVIAKSGTDAEEVWLNEPAFFAQAPSPVPNTVDVPIDSGTSLAFNLPLSTTLVSTSTFVTHGALSGAVEGTFLTTAAMLGFDPSQDYHAGETITSIATSGLRTTTGAHLRPFIWQYITATQPSSALFDPHPTRPIFGSDDSRAVALGDVDGDADLDAVVANRDDPTRVYANTDGVGSFSSLSSFGSSSSSDVILSDLDNDGDLDAVVTGINITPDGPLPWPDTVWMNNGVGVFSAHPTSPTLGTSPTASRKLSVGDINGDSFNDVIVVNATGNNLTVWINDGSGGFSPHPITPYFGASNARNIALGDLDLDGDLDLVVANDADQPQTVWLNDGDGNYSEHPDTPTFGAGDSRAVALGDLDGDGDLDAVIANRGSGLPGQVENVWINDGTGSFIPHPLYPNFGIHFSVAVDLGDLDGDGDLDAVITNELFYQTVWLNDGNGRFTSHPTDYTFGYLFSADTELGDLDGDGDLDAVIANIKVGGDGANTTWMNRKLDLAISKLASPDSSIPTGTISYYLEFSHAEDGIAASFIMTDTMPSELTNLQVSASPGLVLDQLPGQPYVWEVDNSTGLASGTITVTGTIIEGLSAGTIFGNQVSIYNPVDLNALNDTADVDVTVLNAAPELNPIGDKFIYAYDTLTFTASADDFNGDNLTYSLNGEPDGATINPTSGFFSWTPTDDQFKNVYTFDVCVSDGFESDCESITVTVYGALDIAVSKQASPDRAIPTGTISYNLEFSHTKDAVAMSFIMTDTIPAELTNLQVTASPGLILEVLPGQPYIWEVDNPTGLASGTITVTGTILEGLTAGATFGNTVVVYHPSDRNNANDVSDAEVLILNAAPELNPIGDKHIYADETLTFTASASDLNWDDLTFLLAGAPTGASIYPDTGAFTWNPQPSQIDQSYPFDVCVSDGDLDDCETISVSVTSRLLFLPVIYK